MRGQRGQHMIETMRTLSTELLATTGGEFNAMPIIIGAIALVVLGGAAMLVMRRRREADHPDGGPAAEPTPRPGADPDAP